MKKEKDTAGLFKMRFAFLATLAGKLRLLRPKLLDIDSITISKIDITDGNIHYNYHTTIVGRQKDLLHPFFQDDFIHQDECLWWPAKKLSPALRRKLKK